jgi:signal transduction histidine kinase
MVTSEELVVEANGQLRTFLTVKTPLRDEHDTIYAICGVATDITTRIEMEESLRARAEELAVLMDATPAAVWIAADPDGRDIRGSREAYELLRMPAGANLSKSPDNAAPTSHFRVFEEGVELSTEQLPVQRAARGEELRNFEEEVVFENGDRVWLFGNAMPLRAADGTPRGAISAFVDISEHKRVVENLRGAQAGAEAANRAKDEFLAIISHELRTPLNAVLGYVRMLREGVLPPERVQPALATIERNALLQLQVIDDILDVSGIHHGKLTLAFESIDVATLVLDAVHTVGPAAADKHVELTHALPDVPLTIQGDGRRLHQALWNILANAVKFTPAGGHVRVSTQADATDVHLIVTDTGIGIDPDFLTHIFDRFTQENAGFTREQGGLGLGLAIVHHIVTAHRGMVTVASAGKGQGASFRIRLPRAADQGT